MTPGMVLTVEPGLYFHAHDETVPPELRGIGVRLEDDLLVTATGSEVFVGCPADRRERHRELDERRASRIAGRTAGRTAGRVVGVGRIPRESGRGLPSGLNSM